MVKALKILEQIKKEFVEKTDNDPVVRRICNVIINEFKDRAGVKENQ